MEPENHIEKSLRECCATKSSPPPFLLKTCMLVEDPSTDEIISWNEDGTAFVVWQPAEFARDLLPTVFKHSNFSSFVRQLNTYGFRKVTTDRWEFKNDRFRRGENDQLCGIRRRKAWSNKSNPNNTTQAHLEQQQRRLLQGDQPTEMNEGQRSSSTSSPASELTTLMEENKRLKQENGVLSSELNIMKMKCKELSELVSIYGSKSSSDIEEVIEDEYNIGPKLFGVRLKVKGEVDKSE